LFLFDINRIVDRHCLEVVVRFVDNSRTVDRHCLEVIGLLILVELLTVTV